MDNFHDRMAKRFGGYDFGTNEPKYSSEYLDENPEELFEHWLLRLAGPEVVALDIGCGDGKFALDICALFSRISGIDTSQELLAVAESHNTELGIHKVEFMFRDAPQSDLPTEAFDIAFCRRGPAFYAESHRLLKPGGHFLEIGIGERDCVRIKQVFGRGQNFGAWDHPRLPKDVQRFNDLGFSIILARSIIYNEFYESLTDLDEFLQGVPIFEDYDPERDSDRLNAYGDEASSARGILLPRHRVV